MIVCRKWMQKKYHCTGSTFKLCNCSFSKPYQICVWFSRLEGRWRHPFVDELPQLLDGHAVDVLLTQLGLHRHPAHLLTPCCCQIPLGCDYSLFFVPKYIKGDFFGFFHFLCPIFNTVSFAALLISLCRKMLRSNPERLRLRHWLSDALTTRLDRIHQNIYV